MEDRDYSKDPEADVVVKHVANRFRKGLGTNVFIIGNPGSGKSSQSQRLGELFSLELHGENRITSKNIVDDLIHILEFIKNVKEPGEVLIIEEASVLFPSVRAMSQENLAISKVFDTVRKKRIVLISNAPLWNRIDSHMKSLGHIMIETLRVVRTQKVVVSKFFRLQTNPASGKTYTHTMMRNGRDVHRMYTKLPNKEVWAEYEKSKDEFMDKLYRTLIAKRKAKIKKEMKDITSEVIPSDMTTWTKQQREYYRLKKMENKSMEEIAKELGVSERRVYQIRKKVQEYQQNA